MRGSICKDLEYNASSSSKSVSSNKYAVTFGICSILYGVCWKWRISLMTCASCEMTQFEMDCIRRLGYSEQLSDQIEFIASVFCKRKFAR